MKLYSAISLIVVLLAVGARCQNYQLVPSMEQAAPVPWTPISESERAFGLFYYLIISSLLTTKYTSTTTTTSTVTSTSTFSTTATYTTVAKATTSVTLYTTVTTSCTISTASTCAGRRRRRYLFDSDPEPMLVEPSATVAKAIETETKTEEEPVAESVQRPVRSPQFYKSYWGSDYFDDASPYAPTAYQPPFVGRLPVPPASYPIRSSQSSLFRQGISEGGDDDYVRVPALAPRQFSRVVTTIYVTSSTTVTKTTTSTPRATSTSTSTKSVTVFTTTTTTSSVTAVCISAASLNLNYCT